MNGVIMQRIIGLAFATFAFSSLSGVPATARATESVSSLDQGTQRSTIDVAALLTAARGAPPRICSLAAGSVGNGWGGWADAPYTPLAASAGPLTNSGRDGRTFSTEDVQRLFSGLSSDDACVRELSVRLIGTQRSEVVGSELISRLGASDGATRAVAALGLGLVEAQTGVEPLIRALRDAATEVRANSAWALGRIENGRALNPLVNLFSDDAEKVREAAVAAVGHLESTSAVPSLIRVARQDNSPNVRRVAVWALGKME